MFWRYRPTLFTTTPGFHGGSGEGYGPSDSSLQGSEPNNHHLLTTFVLGAHVVPIDLLIPQQASTVYNHVPVASPTYTICPATPER